jgi:hypothetical protein
MTLAGLQLGVHQVRAVVLTQWPRRRAQAFEVPFDPERPDEAVDTLRALIGTPRRIAVAIDLQLLRTKRVTLPALSAADRRNILLLEPERFFAVRGDEIVPAVRADDELVFAVAASSLARWIEAIERIGPVDLVEPAPGALARALATASIGDALVVFDGQDAGIAIAEISRQRVTRARRPYDTLPRVAAVLAADGFPTPGCTTAYLDPWTDARHVALAGLFPNVSLEPLPALGPAHHGVGVAGTFAVAYGTALALDDAPPLAETLVSPAHAVKIRRRRVRALGAAAAACAAAFLFALSSLDSRREREAIDLDAASVALTAHAAPALAMQAELASLTQRSEAMRAIGVERPDPLHVLHALSIALPPGAFVREIRGEGLDWQVDGYAPNASATLAALGAGTAFRDVHFLSATNRAQIANRAYESFALAFRFASTP